MNATNILGISEDLWNLIQSNMENQPYQVQQMLADKLDEYKKWGNHYVDENIWEIQDLYRNEEQIKLEKKKEENEKVILIKPYEVLTMRTSTTIESSFIHDKIKNLE